MLRAWLYAATFNLGATMTTIRALQTSLPWTIRYSRDFRASPQTHKDFAHALHHVSKAAGKLHALADDMDHDREVADDKTLRERFGKYIADLVVCALRLANTFPGGVVDLERTVIDRIAEKNVVTSPTASVGYIGDVQFIARVSVADVDPETLSVYEKILAKRDTEVKEAHAECAALRRAYLYERDRADRATSLLTVIASNTTHSAESIEQLRTKAPIKLHSHSPWCAALPLPITTADEPACDCGLGFAK